MKYLLYFIISIGLLLYPASVSAQEATISVSPPQIEVLIKPGASLIYAFDFKNHADPIIASVNVVSFNPYGEQGGRTFKRKAEGPVYFSLENSNIALGEKFALESKGNFQALLKVRAVDNAPQGDYYYVILLTTHPPVSQATAEKSSVSVGANILVSVSTIGVTEAQGSVALFQVIPRYKFTIFGKVFNIIDIKDEVPVVLKIANVGKHFVVPKATLVLTGPFIKKQTKKLLSQVVLSESQRLLQTKNTPLCKRCQRSVSVVFQGSYFGKYFISAKIDFEGAQKTVFANTEFWAFPIGLVKIISLLFIAALAVLFIIRKRKP